NDSAILIWHGQPDRSSRQRIDRHRGNPSLASQSAITDTHREKQRTVMERRERNATEALIKGRRWYANKLLVFQKFPNSRAACRVLLQTSRQLIQDSQAALPGPRIFLHSTAPHVNS